jgi:hypothetical protein
VKALGGGTNTEETEESEERKKEESLRNLLKEAYIYIYTIS